MASLKSSLSRMISQALPPSSGIDPNTEPLGRTKSSVSSRALINSAADSSNFSFEEFDITRVLTS